MNWSNQSVKFKIFRGFEEEFRWAARSTFRLDRQSAPDLASRDPLVTRIVHELAERRAINIKETLESFETFARVRRRVRRSAVADLCCGHGLTGLIFAAIERRVEHVFLLDHQKPKKADDVLEAVCAAAPWAREKVRWVEAKVEEADRHLPAGCGLVAVHACGVRTDRAIDAAIELKSPIAMVPCCYNQTSKQAPRALRDAFGAEVSTDIARTYRLESAGFDVEWAAIPDAITPMNRVLVGQPRIAAPKG